MASNSLCKRLGVPFKRRPKLLQLTTRRGTLVPLLGCKTTEKALARKRRSLGKVWLLEIPFS